MPPLTSRVNGCKQRSLRTDVMDDVDVDLLEVGLFSADIVAILSSFFICSD